MRILVLSDTHLGDRVVGMPAFFWQLLEGWDAIIHAGDFTEQNLLQDMQMFAPVYHVWGNCDYYVGENDNCQEIFFSLAGKKIYLIHDLKRKREREKADIIISGHTHLPQKNWRGKQLYFNPGSFTVPRNGFSPSYGVLEINEKTKEIVAKINFF